MDEGCAAGGRLTRPQVLGRRVLPLIIAICVGCCLIFGTAPVTANPVRRDPPASGWQGAGVLSRERRSGVAVDDVTGTKLSDSQSASSDLEEEVHRLSRRALVYNSVAKRSLPYFISTPRTARQGLDIGSANGQFAFIWSDGHPRIAQWDSSRGVVKNRWFLLRKPLLKVGCRNFDTKWSTVGEITVNCGSKLVLSVNVSSATQSGQVKARLVTIDNLGNVRFYGPQKASGSSLLLTLTPSFNNYTGSPAANLKVWRPVSPNIKAKTTKASPEKTKTTKARVPTTTRRTSTWASKTATTKSTVFAGITPVTKHSSARHTSSSASVTETLAVSPSQTAQTATETKTLMTTETTNYHPSSIATDESTRTGTRTSTTRSATTTLQAASTTKAPTSTQSSTPSPTASLTRTSTTLSQISLSASSTKAATTTKLTSTSPTATLTKSSTTLGQTSTTPAAAAFTTTKSYPMTATPTWNPINTILQPGCRYLPVPYIIPGPGFDKSTVFNIELIACIQSTAYDATFISAAQKWMSVIIGDIPDYSGGNLDCGMLFNGTNVAICSNVDDVLISFVVEPIDGAYGTLGSAGPFYTHNDGNLPITGRMRFDSADWDLMVGRGTLEAVVMHEMGHVLGIGSLWGAFGFLNPANCTSYATPPSPKFLGTQAQSSMSLIDPSNYLNLGYVPVEDIGGLGTRCAHWKEAYLKQELMTGTVSYNGNPLSYLTAMSLQDMGYTVNLSSPIIARTFDVKTALQDPMPGKGDLEIGDCLHGFDINDIIKV